MNRTTVFLALAIALSCNISSAGNSSFVGEWVCENNEVKVTIEDFDGEYNFEVKYSSQNCSGKGKINSAGTVMKTEGVCGSESTRFATSMFRLVDGGTHLTFTAGAGGEQMCSKK
jgi:hypothetical protein